MKKKVNRLIAIVLLIMVLIMAIVINVSSQIKTGYWVVIENNDVVTTREPRTIEQLSEVVKQYYPKSEIDIPEFMKESIFFEIHRYQFRFYVELKKIGKNGKLRKLSKKEIREIESQK